MFELTAEKSALAVTEREPLVSGAVNVYQARFRFSRDWDGLEKTAVFHALGRTVSVLLEEDGCPVPWEVLERPGRTLYAGVYGVRDGTVVLPTVWAELGRVEPGAAPGDEALPPTPGAYSQLVDMAARAEETARALRADAEAGAFDGADGASGLLPVTRTGAAALTLAANTCAVVTGRPGALSVTLGPPAGGTDTEWRLIFTAGTASS